MNVANSPLVNTQAAAATKATEPNNALGKDAFLRILVTQMKNQNPMEPLKDTEFIGQMAQFSSLEQLTNLNTTMTQFVGGQGNSMLSDFADLIGKKVSWEQETDGQLQSGEGIVKAVSMKNGEIVFELLDKEEKMPIAAIQRIEQNSELLNGQETV